MSDCTKLFPDYINRQKGCVYIIYMYVCVCVFCVLEMTC